MLTLNQEMKMEYLVNAGEARLHRQQEVRLRNKLRKGSRSNVTHAMRLDHYFERMALRREQRYLHLARAFFKDQPYDRVEQSCREGNHPCIDELTAVVEFWLDAKGLRPYVAQWVGQDAG